MKLDSLSELQRRTLVLIKAYEDCRRKAGQFGYRAFKTPPEENLESPVFKQFQTVAKWLSELGWEVSINQSNWVGYVKFVFEQTQPTTPHPGQIKNPVLLRKYIKHSSATTSEPIRSEEDMRNIYRRCLRPEITNSDLNQVCNPLYANSQRT